MEIELRNLLENAEIVSDKDVEESDDDIEITLEEFVDLKGKVYFHKKTNTFYRKRGHDWVKVKIITKKEDFENLYDLCYQFEMEVRKRLKESEAKIQKLEQTQELMIEEFKRYIDLKIKCIK